MPTIDRHSDGAFCYIDLSAHDHHAAAAFYGELLGLTPFPMGPGYTVLQAAGRDVCGMFTAPQGASNPSPHWTLYVAVSDADAMAARAEELGGKAPVKGMDITTLGRTAVVEDPSGVRFQLWQAKDYPGFRVKDEHGAFCWADLITPDVKAVAPFYAGLFGWSLPEAGGGYLHVVNNGVQQGGLAGPVPGTPPRWNVYFQVDDCDAVAEKLKQMGGKVLMGPFQGGDVGRIAFVEDPQGAPFSLFTPMKKAA